MVSVSLSLSLAISQSLDSRFQYLYQPGDVKWAHLAAAVDMRYCDLTEFGISDDTINRIPEKLAEFFHQITQPISSKTSATKAVTTETSATSIASLLIDMDVDVAVTPTTVPDLKSLLSLLLSFHKKLKASNTPITYDNTVNFWNGEMIRNNLPSVADYPDKYAKFSSLAKLTVTYLPLIRGVLSVQAAEVASERLFSAASFVQSDRRARIAPDRLEELVIIKFSSHSTEAFATSLRPGLLNFKKAGSPAAKRNKEAETQKPAEDQTKDNDVLVIDPNAETVMAEPEEDLATPLVLDDDPIVQVEEVQYTSEKLKTNVTETHYVL